MIKPNDKSVERIVMNICGSNIREERRRYYATVAQAFYATPVHKRLEFLHKTAIAMRDAGLYSSRLPVGSYNMFSVLHGIHNLVRTPGDSWSWHKFCDRVEVDCGDIRQYFSRKRRTA